MAVRRPLPAVGLALSLLGAAVAGYLTVEHGRGASPVCAFGGGCEVVARSSYATLAGIPTAAFGLLMYLFLLVSYAVRVFSPPPPEVEKAFRLTTLAVVLAGVGISAWLTQVQLYRLHAVCIWCTSSAVVMALLLIVAASDFYLARHSPLGLPVVEGPLPSKRP